MKKFISILLVAIFMFVFANVVMAEPEIPDLPPAIMLGDVNYDQSCDMIDVILVSRYSLFGYSDSPIFNEFAADMNADGIVNMTDAALLLRVVMLTIN